MSRTYRQRRSRAAATAPASESARTGAQRSTPNSWSRSRPRWPRYSVGARTVQARSHSRVCRRPTCRTRRTTWPIWASASYVDAAAKVTPTSAPQRRDRPPSGPAHEARHDRDGQQEEPGLGRDHEREQASGRRDRPPCSRVTEQHEDRGRREEGAGHLRPRRDGEADDGKREGRPQPGQERGARARARQEGQAKRQGQRQGAGEIDDDHGARPSRQPVAREEPHGLKPLKGLRVDPAVLGRPDARRPRGQPAPVEGEVVRPGEVVGQVEILLVEQAVRDQKVVRLVARGRHGRDHVGAEEKVGQEGAEEEGHGGVPGTRRLRGHPPPDGAQQNRRLRADEQHVPGPQDVAQRVVVAHPDQRRRDQEGQGERERLVRQEAATQPAPRIPASEPGVHAGEQDVAGRQPQREQARPGRRVGPVPREARYEGAVGAHSQPERQEPGADRQGHEDADGDLREADRPPRDGSVLAGALRRAGGQVGGRQRHEGRTRPPRAPERAGGADSAGRIHLDPGAPLPQCAASSGGVLLRRPHGSRGDRGACMGHTTAPQSEDRVGAALLGAPLVRRCASSSPTRGMARPIASFVPSGRTRRG